MILSEPCTSGTSHRHDTVDLASSCRGSGGGGGVAWRRSFPTSLRSAVAERRCAAISDEDGLFVGVSSGTKGSIRHEVCEKTTLAYVVPSGRLVRQHRRQNYIYRTILHILSITPSATSCRPTTRSPSPLRRMRSPAAHSPRTSARKTTPSSSLLEHYVALCELLQMSKDWTDLTCSSHGGMTRTYRPDTHSACLSLPT